MTKADLRTCVAVVLGLLGLAELALAQPPPPPPGRVVNVFRSGPVDTNALPDLSIPEAPAFAILGVDPQSVVRPATPRRFGAGVLNGFDDNGNFQSGLALDVSPVRMLLGERLTIANYRREGPWGWTQRFASRTQLSLATAKGASNDDEAVRMALGLLLTPFDLGDPRLDRQLDACFDRVVQFPDLGGLTADRIVPATGDAPPPIEANAAKFAAGLKQCRDERAKARWNRSAWQLGIAPAWIDRRVSGDDGLEYNGFGAWTSLAWGFEGWNWTDDTQPAAQAADADPAAGPDLIAAIQENSQLILHARYLSKQDQLDPDVKDSFFEADTTFVGARLRLGTPTLSVSFDGSYNYLDPSGSRKTDSFFRLSGGGTLRLWNDLWLDTSVGGTGGRALEDNAYVNVSLRFGPTQDTLGRLAQVAATQSLGQARPPSGAATGPTPGSAPAP